MSDPLREEEAERGLGSNPAAESRADAQSSAARSPAATEATPTAAARTAAASTPVPPTWRFLFASPWHFAALGAGSGLPRRAPGTWGTLAAWLLFAFLDRWLDLAGWLAVVTAGFFAGAVAAHRTGSRLGVPDSGHIVIDEIVAFWAVLALLPPLFGPLDPVSWHFAAAFLLFRAFDIAKPWPIRTLDTRLKHGIGVMLDDLVAALYTVAVLALWAHFAPR